MTNENNDFNESDIKEFYRFLVHKSQTEVRHFHPYEDAKEKHNDFISSEEELLKFVEKYNGKQNIYVGINERKKDGTTDDEVEFLRTFSIDIESSKREKGIASDEQIKRTYELVQKIEAFLMKYNTVYMVVFSGNGYHIHIPIKETIVDDSNRERFKMKWKLAMEALAKEFELDDIHIDLQIANFSRIIKLPGTQDVKSKRISKIVKNCVRQDNEKFRDFLFSQGMNLSGNTSDLTFKKKTNFIPVKITSLETLPLLTYVSTHSLAEGLSRNNVIFKNLVGACFDAGLDETKTTEIFEKIIKNFPGKTMAEINGWIRKARAEGLHYNPVEINKWIDDNKIPIKKHTFAAADEEDDDVIEMQKTKFTYLFPPKSFIRQYIDCVAEKTDAYPEYNFAAALFLLSVVCNRNVKINILPFPIYTNLWITVIGTSSITRKSTALRFPKEILNKTNPFGTATLAGDFTYEGLCDDLMINNDSKRYLIQDEFGMILAALKKNYNSSLPDFLCKLYDCPDSEYARRLRSGGKIQINDVYINLLTATTPVNFARLVDDNIIQTGFLYRFLALYPEYEIKLKSRRTFDPKIINSHLKFVNYLDELNATASKCGINVAVTDACWDIIDAWEIKNRKILLKATKSEVEEHYSQLCARYDGYIFKLATLILLSDSDFLKMLKDLVKNESSLLQSDKKNSALLNEKNSIDDSIKVGPSIASFTTTNNNKINNNNNEFPSFRVSEGAQNTFITSEYTKILQNLEGPLGNSETRKLGHSNIVKVTSSNREESEKIILTLETFEIADGSNVKKFKIPRIELNSTLIQLSATIIEKIFLPNMLSLLSFVDLQKTDKLSTRIYEVLQKGPMTWTQIWKKTKKPERFEMQRAIDTLIEAGVMIEIKEQRGNNIARVFVRTDIKN